MSLRGLLTIKNLIKFNFLTSWCIALCS